MAKDIFCNCCGKKFTMWDIQENISIHKTMGYGSDYDGEEIEIDFCVECFDKIVERCVISPIVKFG